jgi:hypothetical protein
MLNVVCFCTKGKTVLLFQVFIHKLLSLIFPKIFSNPQKSFKDIELNPIF